jgi:hypothetical protein
MVRCPTLEELDQFATSNDPTRTVFTFWDMTDFGQYAEGGRIACRYGCVLFSKLTTFAENKEKSNIFHVLDVEREKAIMLKLTHPNSMKTLDCMNTSDLVDEIQLLLFSNAFVRRDFI